MKDVWCKWAAKAQCWRDSATSTLHPRLLIPVLTCGDVVVFLCGFFVMDVSVCFMLSAPSKLKIIDPGIRLRRFNSYYGWRRQSFSSLRANSTPSLFTAIVTSSSSSTLCYSESSRTS
ncbi:hypothetical protein MPTK1_7g15550 [Marchantia polymorpha subsp. ruderalis]|uniref:Uncharacterized protein n=2 Tax=Marchantia polymorpha TaxID=3197 RepID=A0AAF6C003_MARPO|nr:hypothetical protein MARPO_0009s0239 [Marchantia polymorpha]BBN17587.1 hypothetical protein Mp_7g15550 [Marchantia polymorpha subsp. ruderalis]|eukprot:PTQ47193.1 hypothetical protein MARPO_0009s0239 [Marchantia polymorpha]